MTKKFPRLLLILTGALLLLNIIQSSLTELIYDEAYYWYYAQNMAWGYFDHPPMVALLIKISGFLFGGELGVRFMGSLLGVGTYFIIWAIVEKPKQNHDIWLLFTLLFSMPLLNAYGFLILPDTPLLFFTALFLYWYKKFLQGPSVLIATVLGLSMAALMYSKYHAVLVIVFVLLSNWRLLLNRYAWLAVFISILAYIPHIMWLAQYDFVTIRYHLFDRPNHAYGFSEFTLGYLLNLVIVFGLAFFWFYWALFNSLRNKDAFTKALTYLGLGVILFFFVSSFDRRVQTQWIILICIPMAILAYNFIVHKNINRLWIYRLGIISTVILLYARIGLVYQPLFPVIYESHGNKKWTSELKEKSNGAPVVFENSYGTASMYQFYTGIPAFTLNNIYFRPNQYSIDDSEAKVQHKRVVYTTQYANKGDFSYQHPDSTLFYGIFKDNFESFRKLECHLDTETIDLKQSEVAVKIYNPYAEHIDFSKIRMELVYLNQYKQLVKRSHLEVAANRPKPTLLHAKDTTVVNYDLPKQKIDSVDFVRFAIAENGLYPAMSSPSITIQE